MGQWMTVIENLGGIDLEKVTDSNGKEINCKTYELKQLTIPDIGTTARDAINAHLSKVTNASPISSTTNEWFWSSSENRLNIACRVFFGVSGYLSMGGADPKVNNYRVRCILAF